MYDFASVVWQPQIDDPEERTEMFETNMTKFRGHYYNVLFICASMVYAFVMKLLFKWRQKSRKELQADAQRDDAGQKVSADKRPYKLPLDAWQ